MSAVPSVTLHASALILGEKGVLIRGPSGAGKSSLVLALMEAAAARGMFARLVADDRVRIETRGGRLIASPHPAIAGQIEERGRGILEQTHEGEARIGLVVDIEEKVERIPEDSESETEVAGIPVQRLCLPASLPAETAARRVMSLF